MKIYTQHTDISLTQSVADSLQKKGKKVTLSQKVFLLPLTRVADALFVQFPLGVFKFVVGIIVSPIQGIQKLAKKERSFKQWGLDQAGRHIGKVFFHIYHIGHLPKLTQAPSKKPEEPSTQKKGPPHTPPSNPQTPGDPTQTPGDPTQTPGSSTQTPGQHIPPGNPNPNQPQNPSTPPLPGNPPLPNDLPPPPPPILDQLPPLSGSDQLPPPPDEPPLSSSGGNMPLSITDTMKNTPLPPPKTDVRNVFSTPEPSQTPPPPPPTKTAQSTTTQSNKGSAKLDNHLLAGLAKRKESMKGKGKTTEEIVEEQTEGKKKQLKDEESAKHASQGMINSAQSKHKDSDDVDNTVPEKEPSTWAVHDTRKPPTPVMEIFSQNRDLSPSYHPETPKDPISTTSGTLLESTYEVCKKNVLGSEPGYNPSEPNDNELWWFTKEEVLSHQASCWIESTGKESLHEQVRKVISGYERDVHSNNAEYAKGFLNKIYPRIKRTLAALEWSLTPNVKHPLNGKISDIEDGDIRTQLQRILFLCWDQKILPPNFQPIETKPEMYLVAGTSKIKRLKEEPRNVIDFKDAKNTIKSKFEELNKKFPNQISENDAKETLSNFLPKAIREILELQNIQKERNNQAGPPAGQIQPQVPQKGGWKSLAGKTPNKGWFKKVAVKNPQSGPPSKQVSPTAPGKQPASIPAEQLISSLEPDPENTPPPPSELVDLVNASTEPAAASLQIPSETPTSGDSPSSTTHDEKPLIDFSDETPPSTLPPPLQPISSGIPTPAETTSTTTETSSETTATTQPTSKPPPRQQSSNQGKKKKKGKSHRRS